MQFERAETLSREGNIPVSTLTTAAANISPPQAQLDGAEAALANASLDLEFTEIKAPLAGRIDRRLISVGNLVQADPDHADHHRLARPDRLLLRRR